MDTATLSTWGINIFIRNVIENYVLSMRALHPGSSFGLNVQVYLCQNTPFILANTVATTSTLKNAFLSNSLLNWQCSLCPESMNDITSHRVQPQLLRGHDAQIGP